MAISNLVDSSTKYIRPSVFSRAANDNVEKQSSDFLKLAISDFSSFLSKTNESFEDLVSFSKNTVDGFKAVIKELTNLEKNIRFKFTYFRKDIESSRNDFLTALKAISFDFAGGEGGEGVTPLDAGKPGTSILGKSNDGDDDGGGLPPGGGGGGGKTPKTQTPKTQTPKTQTPKTQTPKTPKTQTPGARPPGTPEKTPTPKRPPKAPPINIEIPNARVSMAYTAPKGAGVKFSTGGAATGKFGLPSGFKPSITSNVPIGTPSVKPAGVPVRTDIVDTVTRNALESGKKSLKILGPVLLLWDAWNRKNADAELKQRYAASENEEEKKEILRQIYGNFGGFAGTWIGGGAGASLGSFLGPIGTVVGGLLGSLKGEEQGALLARALARAGNEGTPLEKAFAIESAQLALSKQEQLLSMAIKEQQRYSPDQKIKNIESARGKTMTDAEKEYHRKQPDLRGRKSAKKENEARLEIIRLQERLDELEGRPSSAGIGDDNATNFSFKPESGIRSWFGMKQNVSQGPGSGGPAEPDLKGSGLEYQSRQTDPMNMMMSYRNMEMDMNPEIYNQSEEGVVGRNTNHPTGPYTAAFTEQEMGGDTVHKFIQRQMNSVPGIENRLM